MKPLYRNFHNAFLPALILSFTFPCSVMAEGEIRYAGGSRRDPFVPLVGPQGIMKLGKGTSGLNVEGIIFDPKAGSIALINGEFYKQGDKVQDATVISIFKDRVILSQNDQEKILWIREEIVQGGEKKHDEKNKPAVSKQ